MLQRQMMCAGGGGRLGGGGGGGATHKVAAVESGVGRPGSARGKCLEGKPHEARRSTGQWMKIRMRQFHYNVKSWMVGDKERGVGMIFWSPLCARRRKNICKKKKKT